MTGILRTGVELIEEYQELARGEGWDGSLPTSHGIAKDLSLDLGLVRRALAKDERLGLVRGIVGQFQADARGGRKVTLRVKRYIVIRVR